MPSCPCLSTVARDGSPADRRRGRRCLHPPASARLVLSAETTRAADPYAGAVVAVPLTFMREARPADAPPVGRVDWLLVGGFAAAVLIEGVVRPDVPLRPVVIVLTLALIPALLWRRGHPLTAALLGFGIAALLSVLQLAANTDDLGLYTTMVIPILLYALVRWGSGREVVVGLVFVTAVVVLGMYTSSADPGEIFGGTVFLSLFVSLAAVFRYRSALWNRQQLEIRNEERVALARELHDIVAHHVSAIAVQAQAGGAVADAQPGRAAQVLSAIESEASQTLAEMRTMVRMLREGEAVDYSPQPGVGDLPALAVTGATPAVEVLLDGSVTQLARPVDAAIYRLAQEALTNAVRHGRNVTDVGIVVRREGDAVRLRVVDDGRIEPGAAPTSGFGLTGMAERSKLLGGSFTAGPGPSGGWVVEAVLPVEAPT